MRTTFTLLASLSTVAMTAIEKPNILFIMTDQQSFNMVSALSDISSESYSNTPNIDRLVKRGFTLTNTYVANPLSVPSRFSLFTGHYGSGYKVRENQAKEADGTSVRTMAQEYGMGNIFLRAGYETYYAGKVHLPFSALSPKSSNKFLNPETYGFQHNLSKDERWECANNTANFLRERKSDKPFLCVASFLNPHDICKEASYNINPVVIKNENDIKSMIVKMARDSAATYNTETFNSKIAPPLPANFEATEAFPALTFGQINKPYPDDYWQRYRWIYAWMVNRVDAQIGVVLDALEASEHKDNTIIIFTSDHGEMQGAHRGVSKGIPYEEAQRVPFIICGKGIAKNKRCDALVCNGTDLIPTMCELAEIEYPKVVYGKSFAKVARGKGKAPQREYLYTEGHGFFSVHHVDGFKYSYFDKRQGMDMLIDLTNDYGEMRNIAPKHPKKTKELKAYMLDMQKTILEVRKK